MLQLGTGISCCNLELEYWNQINLAFDVVTANDWNLMMQQLRTGM